MTKRNLIVLPLLVIACLLAALMPVSAQDTSEDLTGVWVGVMYQAPSWGGAVYPFAMVLTQDGDTVVGESYMVLMDDPENFGVMELNGTFSNTRFDFTESDMAEQSPADFMWCLKNGALMLTDDGLNGSFESTSCGIGKITLVKVNDTPSLVSVENPLNGVWVGTLNQQSGGVSSSYPFAMMLGQNDESVIGMSAISLPDTPWTFGVIALNGTFSDNQFDFIETEITQQTTEDFRWCLKTGTLSLDDTEFSGTWSGDQGCSPGTIKLMRLF